MLDLEVPMKVLESRAATRLVHRSTGLPAQLESMAAGEMVLEEGQEEQELMSMSRLLVPPGVAQDMAVHEEALLRRSDDAPERLQQRLQRYADNIAALRHFYGSERCTALDGTWKKQDLLSEALRSINVHEIKPPYASPPKVTFSSPVPRGVVTPAYHLTLARRLLFEGRQRLESAQEQLRLFSLEVSSNAKWITKNSTEPCGCSTAAKIYVGRDPPNLRCCMASAPEMKHLLTECSNGLRAAREIYVRRQYGDIPPWFSWLAVCCCPATHETEQLQAEYNALATKASDVQNKLTTETTKTAKQTTSSYCAWHLPPPPLPGSP